MRVVSALLMVYFFIIMVRVILSWVPTSTEGTQKIKAFIARLTDPYMNRFRNISWLRFGMLDFSPILGLAILSFFLYLTQSLSAGSIPTVGSLILLIIQMVWGIVAFLAMFFAVIMLVRLVTLYTVKGRPTWIDRLDAFLFPRVSRILGVFTNKTVAYPVALAVCAAVLIILRLLVGWALMRYLYPILMKI